MNGHSSVHKGRLQQRRRRRHCRRPNKKRRRRQYARYQANTMQRHLIVAEQDSERKQQQKLHSQIIVQREQELLSRTIYVTHVMDLKRGQNLARLQQFFHSNYGDCEWCKIANYSGRSRAQQKSYYPSARVRFRYTRDAENFFGGRPLLEARSQRQSVELPCEVGHRGYVVVLASNPYSDMIQELKNAPISIETSGMALGHWFIGEEDEYVAFLASSSKDEEVGTSKAGVPRNITTIAAPIDDWVEEAMTTHTPSLTIDVQERSVRLSFRSTSSSSQIGNDMLLASMVDLVLSDTYELSFRFKDISGALELYKESPQLFSLFFRLKHPPRLYKRNGLFGSLLGEVRAERCTQMQGISRESLGSCLSYMLQISRSEAEKLLSDFNAMEKLRRFGILRDRTHHGTASPRKTTLPTDGMHRDMLEGKLAHVHDLDAKIGVLLRSLLDNGKFIWYDAMNNFGESGEDIFDMALSYSQRRERDYAVQALHEISALSGRTRFPADLLESIVSVISTRQKTPPEYCMEIPRVLLTPLRLSVVGFGVEVSNRVVRNYVSDRGGGFRREAFIRVSVGDENGDKLFSEDWSSDVELRIKQLLLTGLLLNGRLYKFLAYSSSQLKELSVWMVCPEHGETIGSMRQWMGDFSACKTPSKYAARIGQCFSTTFQTLSGHTGFYRKDQSSLRVYDKLEDIPSQIAGKEMVICHSDGTGLISRDVMMSLVEKVPFAPSDPNEVSIIQVRWGGAKGTLVAWDFSDLSSTIRLPTGFDAFLRPSMVKFKSEYRHLEVISIGDHVPYYLNRNVVLLLSYHGICDDTFVRMQNAMLRDLTQMLHDPDKAADLLPRLSGPDSSLTATLLRMISSGLSPMDEPFLFDCLNAVRAHHLQNLRKKARIHVRDGAVLMGGLDEMELLKEGEVFVNVRKHGDSTRGEFKTVEGPVLVTKHPVMHPGDVRMLKAVDIPELRSHRNVILFSQRGIRPETNKMSGSDLDGDQFAVTWDERFFLASNHSPMDYVPPSELPSNSPIDDEALISHFVSHAKNANLGQISMLWVDYATMKNAGCYECIQLAGLHSVAIDYPKSGIPAVVPKSLALGRNTPRAHWRERQQSYHDVGVVGKLYDAVIEEIGKTGDLTQAKRALAGRKYDRYGQLVSCVPDEILIDRLQNVYKDNLAFRLGLYAEESMREAEMIELAHESRHLYEDQLRKLMNKYEIRCEGEVLTGCVRKYHKLHKRRRHEVSEEIRRECREIQREHRYMFYKTVLKLSDGSIASGTIDESDDEEDSLVSLSEEVNASQNIKYTEIAATERTLPPEINTEKYQDIRSTARALAGAYYEVTYNPELRQNHSKWALFSFPWIVADVIECGITELASVGNTAPTL